jgi:hypothetical protein
MVPPPATASLIGAKEFMLHSALASRTGQRALTAVTAKAQLKRETCLQRAERFWPSVLSRIAGSLCLDWVLVVESHHVVSDLGVWCAES